MELIFFLLAGWTGWTVSCASSEDWLMPTGRTFFFDELGAPWSEPDVVFDIYGTDRHAWPPHNKCPRAEQQDMTILPYFLNIT